MVQELFIGYCHVKKSRQVAGFKDIPEPPTPTPHASTAVKFNRICLEVKALVNHYIPHKTIGVFIFMPLFQGMLN